MDDNKPPVPELKLSFLKGELEREFQRCWINCVRTRDYGLEHRMDHGRALNDMRKLLARVDESRAQDAFAIVC